MFFSLDLNVEVVLYDHEVWNGRYVTDFWDRKSLTKLFGSTNSRLKEIRKGKIIVDLLIDFSPFCWRSNLSLCVKILNWCLLFWRIIKRLYSGKNEIGLDREWISSRNYYYPRFLEKIKSKMTCKNYYPHALAD